MNDKLFSEAMNEIDDKYITEAMVERKPKTLYLDWRKFYRIAVCFCAVVLITAFSFGTAFALSADFRQAVISFLFPAYTQNQLHEIDEGHRTGSFSMEDTLFTFLEKFNSENLENNVTVKKENGFEYTVLPTDENTINVIVECTALNAKLLVVMERSNYKETIGLWQVTAYQILDSNAANEMLGISP